jgi:hypothetical protein
MKTRIRGIAKGLAVGTGSLALALSLAACGGNSSDDASGDDGGKINAGDSSDSDSDASSDDASASDDTSSDEASDDSSSSDDASSSDDSSDDSSSDDSSASDDSSSDDSSSDDSGSKSDVSDADIKDAKDQYMDFLKSLGDQDAEKACGFTMDPSTKKPISGAALKVCAKQLEDSGMLDQFTPEMLDVLDESMIDGEATDDGDIKMTIGGEDANATMSKGSDGKWYLKI